MSEYPESTGSSAVTVVRQDNTRLFHIRNSGAAPFNDTFTWTIKEPATLKGIYMYAPYYLAMPGFLMAVLSVTLPNGQALPDMINIFNDGTTIMNDVSIPKAYDITFPVDTVFSLQWVQTSSYVTILWLNFLYRPADFQNPLEVKTGCGLLERALGIGGCDL